MGRVPISEIVVPPGRRILRNVQELASSISQLGLLNPVTLTEEWRLVAGYHRLEACRWLGWTEIPASVVGLSELDAELAEIDENLIRNDLTILERAESLKRRKEIYEAKWPDSKAGIRRAAGMNEVLGHDVGEIVSPTFSADTAAKTKASPRTIQQDVQIATNIAEGVRDQIRDTALADSKQDLLALARLDETQQHEVASRLLDGKAESAKEAIGQLRVETRRDEAKSRTSVDPRPVAGRFDVLYADPPWRYDFAEAESRAVENQYPTLELGEICALPIATFAADDALLFLWATSPKLPEALQVMASWGFEYRTCMVWVKDRIGMGYYARQQHELLLIGKRGNPPVPEPGNRPSSVVHAPRQEHSAKPEEFYRIIECMCPNRSYVELFARRERNGWRSWGNQIPRVS